MRLAWLALVTLTAVTAAWAQQRPRRVEPAGIPVRFTEGSVHGFLELRTADGTLLAPGDLTQVVRDGWIEGRMVFHFQDASVFEETVAFSQRGVFEMQTYHLVQSGPAFASDLDATLSRSGTYVVISRSHRSGKETRYAGSLSLPPDVSNGMVITLAKNLAARESVTVHIVAFTPRPRLVGLQLAPTGSQRVLVGPHAETAVVFDIKPRLGPVLGFFAHLTGKTPPDSHTWIVGGDAPAFVRFEGPMYSGPVWRLDLASPTWPH
ncbi:MAG: hypothetical protein ABSB58_07715 [Gemmatimonadales bacterium]